MIQILRLLLASASPRRVELLRAAGIGVDVDPVEVDERRIGQEPPVVYAERVARMKALAGAASHPDRVVLGADTIVTLDGEILGKPADACDAVNMLRRLSGRTHAVLTSVAVAWRGEIVSHVDRTVVSFLPLSEDEIAWYVASGEPFDKAGGYAIQGLASRFIPRIEGSYSNVVGLPVATVLQILGRLHVLAAVTSAVDASEAAGNWLIRAQTGRILAEERLARRGPAE